MSPSSRELSPSDVLLSLLWWPVLPPCPRSSFGIPVSLSQGTSFAVGSFSGSLAQGSHSLPKLLLPPYLTSALLGPQTNI